MRDAEEHTRGELRGLRESSVGGVGGFSGKRLCLNHTHFLSRGPRDFSERRLARLKYTRRRALSADLFYSYPPRRACVRAPFLKKQTMLDERFRDKIGTFRVFEILVAYLQAARLMKESMEKQEKLISLFPQLLTVQYFFPLSLLKFLSSFL